MQDELSTEKKAVERLSIKKDASRAKISELESIVASLEEEREKLVDDLFKEKKASEELHKLLKEHTEKSRDLTGGLEWRIQELEDQNTSMNSQLEFEKRKATDLEA